MELVVIIVIFVVVYIGIRIVANKTRDVITNKADEIYTNIKNKSESKEPTRLSDIYSSEDENKADHSKDDNQ